MGQGEVRTWVAVHSRVKMSGPGAMGNFSGFVGPDFWLFSWSGASGH